jgi:hypothetical protein
LKEIQPLTPFNKNFMTLMEQFKKQYAPVSQEQEDKNFEQHDRDCARLTKNTLTNLKEEYDCKIQK